MASWYGNTDYQAANPRLLEQAAGGGFGNLKLVGDIANQMTADRLKEEAAIRANKQLAMQETEHQMKVDEQARQLAEINNTKKFYAGLEKPAELATASALFNQNNNPLLQKQIEDMQYKPTDTVEDTTRKTKLQDELGKFGTGMAAMPELQETRLQQGRRLLGEMGANAPLAGIKKLDEMHAAELAANATKATSIDKSLEHANDNWMKLQLEAMKHGTGDTITTTNGTVLPIGGSGKVLNPMKFTVDMAELQKKEHDDGYSRLASNIKSLGAGNLPNLTPEQQAMLQASYNKYTAAGYNPNEVADAVAASLPKTPSAWQFWKDKPTEVTLSPETLKELEPGKRAAAQLLDLKTQEAQMANILAQAKNTGASGADILKTFSPYYQGQIAKATAEKALLGLTPEQRQAQATSSYLGKMMAPKAENADAIASRENATTFYKDGKVSYNKPKGYDDKPPTDNYGVKAITVKAVDEIKRLVDEKDRTSPYADLFAVSSLYESDGNSKATYKEKNGNTAEGLLQWSHPARKEALLKYVNGLTDTQYKSVSDVPANLQYKYFEHDITNGQYKHVGKALASAKTDAEKMQIITDMYEQPAYGAHQAKIRSEGMASYIGSTPKAIEKADREQFNLLLNKENKTAEDTTKLDSLSKILNVGLPKDGEWKPTFEDYTAKERGNKVNIQQLFADASSAPDAPVMSKAVLNNVPKPGYELLADAATDIGKTAKSMIMQSPVGKLFEGKSAAKPAVAVLNNTAAGMLQIAGSPYTAAKLFTDWMVTGKTEDSVFDANAKQAYTTAVAALTDYGIKNPTEQQIVMLVSDMMAPGGSVKTAKGVLPKAVNLSEEAVAGILKSIKNETPKTEAVLHTPKGQAYPLPLTNPRPLGF